MIQYGIFLWNSGYSCSPKPTISTPWSMPGENVYWKGQWECITVRAAEELPRVRNTAFVELHRVCIQTDRNWAIFEEPLKDSRS